MILRFTDFQSFVLRESRIKPTYCFGRWSPFPFVCNFVRSFFSYRRVTIVFQGVYLWTFSKPESSCDEIPITNELVIIWFFIKNKYIVMQSWINLFSSWVILNWSHVLDVIVFVESRMLLTSVSGDIFPVTKDPIDCAIESFAFIHRSFPRDYSISFTMFWWMSWYFRHPRWHFTRYFDDIFQVMDMYPFPFFSRDDYWSVCHHRSDKRNVTSTWNYE